MILKVFYCSIQFMGSCQAAEVPVYYKNHLACQKSAIFELAKVYVPDGYIIKNWTCNDR